MFDKKKILITGGTGSLGQALTKRLLSMNVDSIRIFSRNENKQVIMDEKFHNDRLRFIIGDIRDKSRLQHALEDVDIVPVVEHNPFEAINTNVVGTQNVIAACLEEDVDISVGIGTDKAVSPLNTYGATKLLMEKLFVTASNYMNPDRHKTKFIALRYGNVLGSSGSVIPKFIEQIKNKKKITITDPTMTRFSLSMNEALNFILEATMSGKGSEVHVPKLRAYTIEEVKTALMELVGDSGDEKIPVRQGEKFHETLISKDEMRTTLEGKSEYIVLQNWLSDEKLSTLYPNMTRMKLVRTYSSDQVEKIPKEEFKEILINEGLINSQ